MSTQTQSSSRQPRILFVDDSRLMRACASQILGKQFDLVLAESAEQAWDILQTDPRIEVIFSDLLMAGKSGFDLLQQIRQAEQTHFRELPLVLITGQEDGEAKRKQALMLGATDFISKPFQASELTARARAYARSGRSAKRLRLLEQAHHIDPETGLGNRRYCEERLIQAMSFAKRHHQPLVLMHLRLSGLGPLLNDLGERHATRALERIGETLRQRIRREDTVFRTEPETFTFLLTATDAEGARQLQQRFLPDLDELGLRPEDETLEVTAGFIIQTPPPMNGRDGAQILEDGLAGKSHPPESAQGDPTAAPDIEQALAMIERGEVKRLHPHLKTLERRLMPLLELIEAVDTRRSRRGRGRGNGSRATH